MKLQQLILPVILFVSCSLQAQVSRTPTKAEAIAFTKSEPTYLEVQKELQQLEAKKKELLALMAAFDKQQKAVAGKIATLEKQYDAIGTTSPSGQDQLLNATKQMQETQMSFNLQYLQLQRQMQHENRSYTAISNIMKTKHDTVKNSISNVR
jgi:hypothetical protein